MTEDYDKLTKGKYCTEVLCKNCQNMIYIWIQKGIKSEDFIVKNPLCNICGCEHGG